MNSTTLSAAWASLGDSLSLLFNRLPVADPRRQRVNANTMAAYDESLQAMGRDDDAFEAVLGRLAGRASTLDLGNHAAFEALMAEIEGLLAN
ncbi:hypothetical protein [Sphingomonas sp.]|uniref:hypothetical protein n=1 Tax=Sphingomonas sp. TaxID=28214 RepID=UPI001B2967B3|nr:hypothetical protein [Sphingomonas sp.]MBO9712734.1 hypothetical protein [Sphingomonas sp.]